MLHKMYTSEMYIGLQADALFWALLQVRGYSYSDANQNDLLPLWIFVYCREKCVSLLSPLA